MLYSTAPTAFEGVAVRVVVPPLQRMGTADALTLRLHTGAETTCIEEVEVLSAIISPGKEPGPVHSPVPGPNDNTPLIVEGPPMAIPFTFINKVRAVFTSITSVPLQTWIDPPLLLRMIQPDGNPSCSAFGEA